MASVASLPRPCLSTSREEIRQCGLMLAAGRGRSKKKKNRKKNPPHPKRTTKSTAARRPCPTRDGMRGKHVSRISPYSPASIDLGFVEIGHVQLSQVPIARTASVASFPRPVFLQQMVQKKEKKKQPIPATSNRHSDSHRASHSFKAARSRWKDPLGARGNFLPASVCSASTWWESLDDIQKRCKPLLVLPPFGESPKSINQKTRSSSDHSTSYY